MAEELIDEARYRMLEIKWKIGKYPTRLSMFKEFIKLYPESPRTPSLFLRVGNYYRAAVRYELAVYYFKKVLEDYSDSGVSDEAMFSLGKVYLSMGKTEESIRLLQEALLEKTNRREEIHYELGNIYYNMEDLEKAIQHYREISSPGLLPYAQYQIGLVYFELGLFREARIPLLHIINKFPDSQYLGNAYLLLGKTYLREGYLEEAISIVDQGINKLSGEKNTQLLLLKARIYCQMHKEKGLDIYLKIAEIMGEDIEGAIKILEDGLKCAERLNIAERIEYFQNIIDVLKTHKESN